MNDRSVQEDRGPGAKKESLDRKLQHNAEMEREAKEKQSRKATKHEPSEDQIDEAIEDSFPASDPPSHSSPTAAPGKNRSH